MPNRFQTIALGAFAFTLTCLPSVSLADNWAHWRGPTGNSVQPSGQPPTQWSQSKNVRWEAAIPGFGSGSPVVWEDQVFVVTATGGSSSADQRNLQFKLISFDRASGNVRWEKTCVEARPHQATHGTNGFASASPCTDGQHVYAHFGSRGTYCFSMTGELVWKRIDFGQMTTRNNFGEGSSPTLVENMLLVPWDHEGPSSLYALDKLTGKTIWKTDRDEPTCWATPLVVKHGDQQQVIMNGQTRARAYDLATGKELWSCGGQTQRPVASPVTKDNMVFVGSGFRGAFLGAFKLGGNGNVENTDDVAWTIDRDTPDIASLLLSGNRLYFHKGKTGILTCVDANSGRPFYASKRLPDIRSTYASPVAAGGHVYLTGRSGKIVVIKDAEQLEVISVNSLGEGIDATPAPVDNELFIRGEKHLFCIAENG